MPYVNRNVRGGYDGWESIKIEEDKEREIWMNVFEKNLKCIDFIKQNMPVDKYTDGERVAMINQMTRHYHYGIEEFVDDEIAKGNIK